MTEEDRAIARLEAECPRRILGVLHAKGHYHHFESPRFPGRVLCMHHETRGTEGFTPTQAQRRWWELSERDGAEGGGTAGLPPAG